MKTISIDYDDTYSSNPKLWQEIIELMKASGEYVCCVTSRSPTDPIEHDLGIEVFYASGELKADFMDGTGLFIDIWVDDMPQHIGDA